MVSTKNSGQVFGYQGWNSNVISLFGVFCNEGIITPNLELLNLAQLCRRFHEIEPSRDPLIFVYVHVIAEADLHLAFFCVFVHVAEENISDGIESSYLPIGR